MVGRPGSASVLGGALRPRATTIETNALGANASVTGNFSVVAPAVMRNRRCSIRPSRSTVTQASALVNGHANSTVAVSPTPYRCLSGITSILKRLSSFHGTQSLPVAQRYRLVVAGRPAGSDAWKLTMYEPP